MIIPEGYIQFEPKEIFDEAIIAVEDVLVYSWDLLIESFLEKTEMNYDEIITYLFCNTWGYCPIGWPRYIDDRE